MVWLTSLVLASITLPSLDGTAANIFRLTIYGGMSVIFWVRILIARALKETSKTYYLYVVLMIAAPFLIWPLQRWLVNAMR